MKVDFQTITVIILFCVAVAFIVKKFFFKSSKKDNCGSGNCGC